MNKGLEALKRIKYKLSSSKANGYWEDLDTIETTLKDYEELSKSHKDLERKYYIETLSIDYKKLKAFDFIKQLGIISDQNVVEVQGQWYLISSTILNKSSRKIPITEEQAYMLKEVLL